MFWGFFSTYTNVCKNEGKHFLEKLHSHEILLTFLSTVWAVLNDENQEIVIFGI